MGHPSRKKRNGMLLNYVVKCRLQKNIVALTRCLCPKALSIALGQSNYEIDVGIRS